MRTISERIDNFEDYFYYGIMPEEPQSIIKAPQSGVQMLLFGAIGGVVLASVIFLVLGALNLLPFSKVSQVSTEPQTNQPFSLGCPLEDKKLCAEGKEFTITGAAANQNVYGLGWVPLTGGTPIVAIMDGDNYSQGVSVAQDGEKSQLIVIGNSEQGLEGVYRFKGQANIPNIPTKGIKKGEVVGWIGDGTVVVGLPGTTQEQFSLAVTLQNTFDKTFKQLELSDFK
ncbi:MAG: hypothetical protein Q7S60_05060 [bacterium]|nr:hypothetical protein [bacterium]